ncbi:hypothetical protein [Collinsella aerofaciens]|uniref:hypothetical protein n=1 Tax=Collinsella aerofaciens TaxID=74426 RepID=UPI00189F684E|nr:hypothetical protein [Collinsella aerofaciens]
MAGRTRARETLKLRTVNGLSQNAIARTAHVSENSVQDVLETARKRVVARQARQRVQFDAAGAVARQTASTVFCTQIKK